MIITSTRPKRPEPRPWRITRDDIPVLFQWWYDTVAILDDYFDSEEGILPAGTVVREVERDAGRGRVLCDLEDPRAIEKTQLPEGREVRMKLFCRATPLRAELSVDDWDTRTELFH